MGHLRLDAEVGDMSKFIISFWFRFSSETADTAFERFGDGFGTFNVYSSVIPLLSWGPQQTGIREEFAPAPMPPSYIGVRVWQHDHVERTTLVVHIQTADTSVGQATERRYPDYFGNSEIDVTIIPLGHPPVLADEWNHVIVSCDLQSHTSEAYTSSMWCAINDENISGEPDAEGNWSGLPAMGAGTMGPGGPNNHASNGVYMQVRDELVSVSITDIPSDPFCIPGPGSVNSDGNETEFNPVLNVQMAELQVFAGITLDTGDSSKVRLFVDDEGKPVPAPADLGQNPQICLTGSGAWASGTNSGTLGGWFTPTGEIKTFKPDPSLSAGGLRSEVRLTRRR